MKNIVGGIVLGLLLAGCGEAEMNEGMNSAEPTPLAETEQGLCEDWNNPSNGGRCIAKCGSIWYTVGYYPAIGYDYGQCGFAADNFCLDHFGVYASGACWQD